MQQDTEVEKEGEGEASVTWRPGPEKGAGSCQLPSRFLCFFLRLYFVLSRCVRPGGGIGFRMLL